MQNQSSPLETTSEPCNQSSEMVELLHTRHKMNFSGPVIPEIPAFANDARSGPWALMTVNVSGPYFCCTWRRMTTLAVHVEPAVDAPRPAGELPAELQVGRPQLPELPPAPLGTEEADLYLLEGRMMSPSHSPSAAPPLGIPAPLPHYARERPAPAMQRNVSLRSGQLLPAPMPYEVSVRPSAVDPSLLASVAPAVTPG
jgi:hypothetical protein